MLKKIVLILMIVGFLLIAQEKRINLEDILWYKQWGASEEKILEMAQKRGLVLHKSFETLMKLEKAGLSREIIKKLRALSEGGTIKRKTRLRKLPIRFPVLMDKPKSDIVLKIAGKKKVTVGKSIILGIEIKNKGRGKGRDLELQLQIPSGIRYKNKINGALIKVRIGKLGSGEAKSTQGRLDAIRRGTYKIVGTIYERGVEVSKDELYCEVLAPANDKYEPNNNRSEATVLTGGYYTNLKLISNEEDWYQIKIGKSEILKKVSIIFIHSHGDLDIKVYKGMKELDKSESSNDNEEIVFDKGLRGSCYLKVYAYKGLSNDYSLKVETERIQQEWPSLMALELEVPLAVINQMVYKYGGKKCLDMSCGAWKNMSSGEQFQYTAAYQKAYAKSINKPVERGFKKFGVNLVMRLIPPGRFWIGSPESEKNRSWHEGPRHRVLISSGFWLQKTEVTQRQWKTIIGESPWANVEHMQNNDSHAATYISWDDVKGKLLVKLGSDFNFPTESQWEYSCRGGMLGRFFWGESVRDMGQYANVADATLQEKTGETFAPVKTKDGYVYIAPVGSFKPNAFGLYDMIGNVWEWCKDDARDYNNKEETDPVGKIKSNNRVFRGGGWASNELNCLRSAYRLWTFSSYRHFELGVRLIRRLSNY